MLGIMRSSIVILVVVVLINQTECGKTKRGLSQQQQLDEAMNQQLVEYEKFLLEQQTQLELAQREQLRQLQESQVKLFRAQQEQEAFIAKYQANLNNQKVSQLNQNRPAGQTIDEIKASPPVISPDAALGGANSNSRRKIEHEHKLEQQIRHQESKNHILAQQQLQVDAMNTQNQIQAETRADQQNAFIDHKLEIEQQQAEQREKLLDMIDEEIRGRQLKSLDLNQDEEAKSAKLEKLLNLKFARLMQAEERNKAFEQKMADRREKQLRIEQERVMRRKEQQVSEAQKIQDVLHDTQVTQELFEKNYQKSLEEAKQEQLRQSKVIQEQLHQTQRQLEAQEENQHGVLIMKASELANEMGDQQTRNQKLIIQQHQERIRLAHKMQQNQRLKQDIDHDNTKKGIQLQQAKQLDHMINQHQIQHNERLRQKSLLENLRNQLRMQIDQQRSLHKEIEQETAPPAVQKPEVINPETVYLEPRFFLSESEPVKSEPSNQMQPESKTITITSYKEEIETKEPRKVKAEVVARNASCVDKADGMYRDENDCNSYYVCTEKKMYSFACPSGTAFNMDHCTCDWPTDNTECIVPLLDNQCNKSPEKEEPETKLEEIEETDSTEFSCQNKEKGFYRDPVDCNKFYYCEIFSKPAPLTGQTIIKNDFYCPNNFHFDVFSCKCHEPTAQTCSNQALTTFCTHSS